MGLLDQLLGKHKQENPPTHPVSKEEFSELIRQTVTWYREIACPCAFPRFVQYTSIDCVDWGKSFSMYETEMFIAHALTYYIKGIEQGEGAIYSCNKCGSSFQFGWSDFSIHVSRSYFKPLQLNATQVGADAQTPIPYYGGFAGHALPDQQLFHRVDAATFIAYIRALHS